MRESRQGQGHAPIRRQRTEETTAKESQHRQQDVPRSHAVNIVLFRIERATRHHSMNGSKGVTLAFIF